MSALRAMFVVLPLCLLAGCAGPEPGSGEDGLLAPNRAATSIAPEDQVRGPDNPAIVVLELDDDVLTGRNARETEALPAGGDLGVVNFRGVPLIAALQAVLGGTDISLTWADDELAQRPVTILNLTGDLPRVVERVCAAARLYCSYRNGVLEVLERETFIIELPPVGEDTENTIASAIETLSDGEIVTDTAGGNLIYTADTAGHLRVQEYLRQLRNGRPLVVLQLYIWEVTLTNNQERGIDWKASELANLIEGKQAAAISGGTGISNIAGAATATANALSADAIGNSISFGAVFSGAVNASTILSFLSTQGQVQTISNPQLTFVSGGRAEFTVGGTQRYISQVGQLSGTSTTGEDTPTSSSSQNTVTTEEIETGLTVEASGSYEGGVFLGNLRLTETLLVQIRSVPTGQTQIQLPETQDRDLSTVLRLRPGDNLVLAGLSTSAATVNRRGMPTGLLGDIPTYGQNNQSSRELVILIRPSVVLFRDPESMQIQLALPPEGGAEIEPVVIEGAPTDLGTSTTAQPENALGAALAGGGTPTALTPLLQQQFPGAPLPTGLAAPQLPANEAANSLQQALEDSLPAAPPEQPVPAPAPEAAPATAEPAAAPPAPAESDEPVVPAPEEPEPAAEGDDAP